MSSPSATEARPDPAPALPLPAADPLEPPGPAPPAVAARTISIATYTPKWVRDHLGDAAE